MNLLAVSPSLPWHKGTLMPTTPKASPNRVPGIPALSPPPGLGHTCSCSLSATERNVPSLGLSRYGFYGGKHFMTFPPCQVGKFRQGIMQDSFPERLASCQKVSKIIQSIELEETFKGHLVQLPCKEQEHLQLHQVLRYTSSLTLNVSMDRAYTTSPGNLCQCLTTHTVRNFFLYPV
uniref:Uncharacterized protein n=1 Tax=Pavo cristatus TaxID=9049 RepID=A0A8C9EVD1_PAVCR